jgi:hypothetical protein
MILGGCGRYRLGLLGMVLGGWGMGARCVTRGGVIEWQHVDLVRKEFAFEFFGDVANCFCSVDGVGDWRCCGGSDCGSSW